MYTVILARDISEYTILSIHAADDDAARAEARALRDADAWTATGRGEYPCQQRIVSLADGPDLLLEDEMLEDEAARVRIAEAAPALLEALREARSYVFHMTSDLPSSRPWNALLSRLDAAIAKATGEV